MDLKLFKSGKLWGTSLTNIIYCFLAGLIMNFHLLNIPMNSQQLLQLFENYQITCIHVIIKRKYNFHKHMIVVVLDNLHEDPLRDYCIISSQLKPTKDFLPNY